MRLRAQKRPNGDGQISRHQGYAARGQFAVAADCTADAAPAGPASDRPGLLAVARPV